MWLSVTTRAFLLTSSLCSCPIFHHEQAHPHPFAHRAHSFPRDSSGYLPGTREQSAFHISVLIFLHRILWGKELFSHFNATGELRNWATGELRLKKKKKLSPEVNCLVFFLDQSHCEKSYWHTKDTMNQENLRTSGLEPSYLLIHKTQVNKPNH